MRCRGRRTSSNVDDRRRRVGKRGVAAGGAGAIIMALIAVFVLGQDPATVLQQVVTQSSTGTTQQRTPSAAEDDAAEMSKVVLATTEDVWGALFQQSGSGYAPPTLVLFADSTQTGGGVGAEDPRPGRRHLWLTGQVLLEQMDDWIEIVELERWKLISAF